MNLQDIVCDVTAGFSGGFLIGMSDYANKTREKLEYIDAALTPEQQKEAGLSPKSIGIYKKADSVHKLVLPYLYSTAYSLYSIFEFNQNMNSNMAATLPAAYLGQIAGKAVRKIKRRKYNEDLEILRAMKRDPKNILAYVPEEHRNEINVALNRIEGGGKAEGMEKIFEESFRGEGVMIDLHKVIRKGDRPYAPFIQAWTVLKMKEIFENLIKHGEIVNFYENAPLQAAAVLGSTDKSKINAYNLDGKNVRVYLAEFPGIHMESDDTMRMAMLELKMPDLSIISEYQWDGNYKSLADSVMSSSKEQAVILLKTPANTPEHTRKIIIADTFARQFAMQEIEKRNSEMEDQEEQ